MPLRLCFIILIAITLTTCKVVDYRNVYQPISEKEYNKRPKQVILMIGDGMGLAHITAAMYANNGRSVLERFPVVGLQKCHSADALATDSAAAATALACGVKTFNQAIGVDIDTIPKKSILIEAAEKNWATGIVTTSSLVHATPAAFYAHSPLRYQYENIAADFVDSGVDFAVGGGKKYFDRRDQDERNLVIELEKKGYWVSSFLEHNLSAAATSSTHPFLFFTSDQEPLPATQGREYLPAASKMATRFLSQRKPGGFFLLIEGAQIDWAGHAKNGTELLSETKDFEKAVEAVLEFVLQDKETLLIVTADHETGGMTINPSSKLNKLKLEFASNAHTPQMVPVFATGPGAAFFSGVYDNTEIYKKLHFLMGFE